jgi:hypothetical protein
VWHPVAFLSKALNPVERNYKIHDTEMLAIIRGLEEWRHYLEGARHPVEIWTDHKNLKYFHVAQKLNRCQARCTISQVEVWVNQMCSLGELIMVQVKVITTTSPYSPQNYFESMHSQARD